MATAGSSSAPLVASAVTSRLREIAAACGSTVTRKTCPGLGRHEAAGDALKQRHHQPQHHDEPREASTVRPQQEAHPPV